MMRELAPVVVMVAAMLAVALVVWLMASDPPTYVPNEARRAEYDAFMRECVAHSVNTTGHMRDCQAGAAELGLALRVVAPKETHP